MSDFDAKTAAQAEMFANRLKKRFTHLKKWARRSGIEAYRLYDRDIPEIPLVLDLYGDTVSGALYKRPYEKDEAEESNWIDCMRDAAVIGLGINRENIIIKRRERQYGNSQYEKRAGRELIREIKEENFKFKVNLSDYLDTGLFLDRRILRRIVREDAADKSVLNLFCYTASFSLYAAGGGAVSTDSVDLSNTYLGWAKENFSLNGYKAELLHINEFFSGNRDRPKNSHRLIRADVPLFLRKAAEAGLRRDLIILDPPAFSNSKMAGNDFDLQKDYINLLSNCLSLLSPGGKLWFSVSSRSFKSGASRLEVLLSGKFPGLQINDISEKTVDEDFRGRKIPKTFLLSI